MRLRKVFNVILVVLLGVIISILFGQLLGGYYIYNLLGADNLQNQGKQQAQVQIQTQTAPKKKVLRLDPIRFYTIQLGIFSESQSAQATVAELTELGLQPFVAGDSSYRIWVGCFSDINSGRKLESYLSTRGFEAFIGEGLINDRALKFPSNNSYMQENFAPLLGKYDLILNHSLKMFKSPFFSEYDAEVWQEMVSKVEQEVLTAIAATEEILELTETGAYQEAILNVKEKARLYSNTLEEITQLQKDEAVLQSQSRLLELISAYHNLINRTNKYLGTD